MSGGLAGRSLAQLLGDVAAATPAPGGGCSAAWACALAAALVEMTAAITLERADHADRRGRMQQIAARARSLRESALELGQRELHSYEPVLVALRAPREDPERLVHIDAALSAAADTPLEIARVGAAVAALALDAADAGSTHLRGDAITAVLLADGACRAAAELVRINLAGRSHDGRLPELDELTQRADAARAAALPGR